MLVVNSVHSTISGCILLYVRTFKNFVMSETSKQSWSKVSNQHFTGVVEFLSKGAIAKDHPDLKGFRSDPCIGCFSATEDPKVYTHGLKLSSAIDPVSLPFTNFT